MNQFKHISFSSLFYYPNRPYYSHSLFYYEPDIPYQFFLYFHRFVAFVFFQREHAAAAEGLHAAA